MCGQLCWDSESSSTTRWLSKTSPSLVSEPVSCRVSEPLTSSSFGETTGLALESSNEDSGEVLDFPCPPSSASLSDLHPTASSCRHVSSRYNILSKFRATIADWSLDDDGRRERFGGPKRNREFRNLYCFFRKYSEKNRFDQFSVFLFSKTAVYWNCEQDPKKKRQKRP